MLKILLVDDEKFAIDGLIALLDWSCFEGELVGTASSGEEGLTLMEASHPDVVISDIKMGGMNGIELSDIVHKTYENIQMILLTAHGEFEYAQKAIQCGVIDYILKPITRDKIIKLNNMLKEKNQQMKQQRQSYLTAWDETLENKLVTALRNKERDTLDNFFQSPLFADLMSGSNCNAMGIQIINILYSYLQDMNLDQRALNYSKSETMELFLDTTDRQGKMDFIITKYYDIMTSIVQLNQSHSDAIANYAFRYIDGHYTDPDFNLSGLSYAMHVSLSHLSTVFKQTTGNNLSAYVTDLRMKLAKDLLADMQYSISDISEMSGYSDARYFAKLFKKKVGSTPTEYRNLVIQGNKVDNHVYQFNDADSIEVTDMNE